MLPKIDVPIFDVKLFSTGKKVKFRPFTVKEEKLFLITGETDDPQYDEVFSILNIMVILWASFQF